MMNKIIQGNCMDVMPQLEPYSFAALITDPPYSSGGQHASDRTRPTGEKYCRTCETSEYGKHDFDGDNLDQRSWTNWCREWLEMARALVRPGGVCAIFSDWRQLPAMTDALQWAGWCWRGVLAWDKRNARPQPGRPRQQCEYVLWGSNGSLDVKRNAPYMPGMISAAPPTGRKRSHQTEKPIELMRELVHICEKDGTILDPFCGSGTTVAAAILEGYDVVGIERNAYYAALSRQRIAEIERAA